MILLNLGRNKQGVRWHLFGPIFIMILLVCPVVYGTYWQGDYPSVSDGQIQGVKFDILELPPSRSEAYSDGSSEVRVPTILKSTILWNQTYGGSDYDWGYRVIECSGGGFAIAGSNNRNIWLIRTDRDGNHLWNQTYAKGYLGEAYALVECSTGGFLLCGVYDSGGPSQSDTILIRTNADGVELWNQTYGDTNYDVGYSVIETSSGGFAFCGSTEGYGAVFDDAWLVQTDSDGNHIWNRTYGGLGHDYAYMLVECSTGGFALVGSTRSFGVIATDMWLVRVDVDGIPLWNRTFGGVDWDEGFSLIELDDGGFALQGTTRDGASNEDYWLVRTNATGQHLWNQTYGGLNQEWGVGIIEASDGGFILSGASESYGAGDWDAWIVHTDEYGNHLWNLTCGDTLFEECFWFIECSDGGFVFPGDTESYGAGYSDAWLFRISGPPHWNETPTNQVVEAGFSFRYDLNATGYPAINSWWLNDSSFSIDSAGIIENATILSAGVYGLQVWVDNTVGDAQSANFTVFVEDTTTPSWVDPPIDHILEFTVDSLDYQLNASDFSGIHHWWINDTSHFGIDNFGRLFSQDPLPVAVYGLEVRAYDPHDNFLVGTFRVTSQDTRPPEILMPTQLNMTYGESYSLTGNDPSGIQHWSLNDTVHFAIIAPNELTVKQGTPLGVYGINVTASDPYGNSASTVIQITVYEPVYPPSPNPWFYIIAAGVGIGITVVIIVYIVKRRRS